MARFLYNEPVEATGGGIIKITTWKNASRYVMSQTSGGAGENEWFGNQSISFTKQKSATESYIMVTGIVPGQGMPNYPQIGMMCTIDGLWTMHNATGGPRTGAGGGGAFYCGPDQSSEGTLGIIHKSFREWDIAAGEHFLSAGWRANSGVQSFNQLNPNVNDNNRHHQTATHICIYEITKTT